MLFLISCLMKRGLRIKLSYDEQFSQEINNNILYMLFCDSSNILTQNVETLAKNVSWNTSKSQCETGRSLFQLYVLHIKWMRLLIEARVM